MKTPVIRAWLPAVALLCASCAPLTGNPAQDTARFERDIVAACLTSPLFRAANGVLTAAVPAATLPVDLVDAGVSIVCANPAYYAAIDAATADWVKKVLVPYSWQSGWPRRAPRMEIVP